MIKRLLLVLGMVLAIHSLAFSQGAGSLYGTVTDSKTGESIPFANVAIMSGGVIVTGTQTDFDGKYAIRAINPGTYTLRVSVVGYNTAEITGITIGADKSVPKDVLLNSATTDLEVVEIIEHKVPVFEADQTSSGAIVTAEEISKMPNRSVEGVVTTVSGVYSADGGINSIRGTRSGSEAYYIDGMRVSNLNGIPPSAYEQIATTLSGISARYGDVTSGVINVTTRGASRTFGMSAEVETSQFLDPYGYNMVGLGINGPLWTKKDKETGASRPIIGYFLSGNFTHRQDGSRSAIGWDRVNDETLEYLKKNPLRSSPTGTYQEASFLSPSSVYHSKNSENTSNYRVNAVGRLTIQPTQNIELTFGGNYSYSRGHSSIYSYSLMNWENNPLSTSSTYRVYGRFTQRFPTRPDSKSLVRNFYYTIQADYQSTSSETGSATSGDNIFEYGYWGSFDMDQLVSYEQTADTAVGPQPVWVQNNYYTTNLQFTPGKNNKDMAAYNEFLYNNGWSFNNLDELSLAGGMRNGYAPTSIYSLWTAPGVPYDSYGKSQASRWAIDASGSMDIGGHQVRLGFQYEQQNNSSWGVSARSLWQLMSDRTNFHIAQMDIDNPYWTGKEQGAAIGNADTIYYNRKYDANSQSMFDWNLRNAMGLSTTGTDFIYIDSYDPVKKTIVYYNEKNEKVYHKFEGDLLDMSFFSPEDLFNGGNSYVSYYGYSHDGKKLNSNPTLDDFFNKKVMVNGKEMYSREMAPYSPTYIAGWIEDKFTFNDIIFSIGLRVDGFDANQMVLKDNYSIYPTYTVNDVKKGATSLSNLQNTIPGNMGNDFVVYTDSDVSPTKFNGYRSGNTWYNAEGIVINDPTTISGSSGIATPYLKNPNSIQDGITTEGFEDYKTQVNVMPRISFSFPISDEALFFAHYDILTRRPNNVQMNPLTYLYFTQIVAGNSIINNPSLKPSQTIDYELGFKQKISNNSAISLSAFYKEIRDEVQVYRFSGAYPSEYTSYNNIDFSTVKGITIDYDLRRTKNIRLRAGYTLQFANTTGSSAAQQANLIAARLPNLRTLIPASYDQRHSFNISFDYRFSSGKNYNGPVAKREKKGKTPVQVLSNTGLGITFTGGSGTPYSRQSNISSYVVSTTPLLVGTINGARLPWQFRIDAKLDKDFNFTMGKRKNGETRYGSINVYLSCNNILGTKNVMGVYSTTGMPDDDGFLASPEAESYIKNVLDAETFSYLYGLYMDRPGNYSSPRTLHLGVIFSFF